jgi:regulator of protease activity HflC (stomatin/prohibitin superfamily)
MSDNDDFEYSWQREEREWNERKAWWKAKAKTWGPVLAGFGLAGCGLASSIRIIRPNQLGLVEFLGKYTHTTKPGLRFIPPFGLGRLTRVRMDLCKSEIPGQQIITKEQLNAQVDAVAYYQVRDPFKAIYNVDAYSETVPVLAQTTLRNVLGTFSLAEANSQRKLINDMLQKELQAQIDEWGIKVMNVEMKSIQPTTRVQESMNNIIIAEQEKIAATNAAHAVEIAADGQRRAVIKAAEGDAQGVILKATAEADATRLKAKASADALQMECDAAQQYFTGNVLPYWRMKTTQASLENNTTVLLPKEGGTWNIFDVVSAMGKKSQ